MNTDNIMYSIKTYLKRTSLIHTCSAVFQPISESESHLQHRVSTCLHYMVARYGDGIVVGHMLQCG